MRKQPPTNSHVSQNLETLRKKAGYWDQTKKFIQNKLANEIRINSIHSGADDSDVLE